MDTSTRTYDQPPIIRIRNEHSHTLKDGWRLASATVEITTPLLNGAIADLDEVLRFLQRLAFAAGQDEATLRNAGGEAHP